MNFEPMGDKVVIMPMERIKKIGSIYVPENHKEKPRQGKVIAVGPGRISEHGVLIKPQLKIGDSVLYGKYSGTEMAVLGDDYLVMRESDVLIVMVDEKKPEE